MRSAQDLRWWVGERLKEKVVGGLSVLAVLTFFAWGPLAYWVTGEVQLFIGIWVFDTIGIAAIVAFLSDTWRWSRLALRFPWLVKNEPDYQEYLESIRIGAS